VVRSLALEADVNGRLLVVGRHLRRVALVGGAPLLAIDAVAQLRRRLTWHVDRLGVVEAREPDLPVAEGLLLRQGVDRLGEVPVVVRELGCGLLRLGLNCVEVGWMQLVVHRGDADAVEWRRALGLVGRLCQLS